MGAGWWDLTLTGGLKVPWLGGCGLDGLHQGVLYSLSSRRCQIVALINFDLSQLTTFLSVTNTCDL